jgi:hypothetical protein
MTYRAGTSRLDAEELRALDDTLMVALGIPTS